MVITKSRVKTVGYRSVRLLHKPMKVRIRLQELILYCEETEIPQIPEQDTPNILKIFSAFAEYGILFSVPFPTFDFSRRHLISFSFHSKFIFITFEEI